MIPRLLATDDSIATALLRLVLGLVFFAHGAQKMLGWFGGFGFSDTMVFFTGSMHIPAPLAFLAISAELFGELGLILGFLTRIAAFGIAVNMPVAIATAAARNPANKIPSCFSVGSPELARVRAHLAPPRRRRCRTAGGDKDFSASQPVDLQFSLF
jgi:uncharacterized membrane protein YphA (DoxX/SURF4 family)